MLSQRSGDLWPTRAWSAGRGRWSSTSALPWWDCICHTVPSSGLLSSRKTGNCWSKSSKQLERWLETWSISLMRKGWETWVCSAWRKDDWGGILAMLIVANGQESSGWGQALLNGPQWQNRGQQAQTRKQKFHTNGRKDLSLTRVIEHWNRLPREMSECLLWRYWKPTWMLLCTVPELAESWIRWSPEMPSNPYNCDSAIL